MTEQEKYMRRCIALALKAEGCTYPNPMVGAIIVHKGKIIGEGWHKKAGEPHAEINAINSVENPELLPFSEIYVSLEPCSHFGKTPPCAMKLKEVGFKKVIVGASDSNEKVNGGGIEILQDAEIPVIKGILEKDCRELNKRFFTFHEKKRPYIVLKWAESVDGFIDKNFRATQIGNALTKQFVHQLRAREHAILVGKNTALSDNPALTTREISGRNPVRILLDSQLSVPSDFKIFNDEAPTLVFNSLKNETAANIKFIKAENTLESLLQGLYEQEIQSVLVEGGRNVLQQFINAGIWDEAVVIKNPNLILKNGTKAPNFNNISTKTENFDGNIVEFHIYKNAKV